MRPASCQQCGKTISQKSTGRIRRFCSGRCRQRSYVEGTTHRQTERSSKDIEEQVRRAADEARARALADVYHEVQKFLAATVRKDLTDLARLLEQGALDAVVGCVKDSGQAV